MNTPENNESEAPEASPAPAAAKSERGAALARAARAGLLAVLRLIGRFLAICGRLLFRGTMIALRAFGKFSITTWRLASALDSALWRAVKLLLRRLGDACLHAMKARRLVPSPNGPMQSAHRGF